MTTLLIVIAGFIYLGIVCFLGNVLGFSDRSDNPGPWLTTQEKAEI